MKKNQINVVITGAAGNIGYSLLTLLINGDIFGPDNYLHIKLLQIPQKYQILEAIEMEIFDSAKQLVLSVQSLIDPGMAFKNADFIFFIGAHPRTPGMDRGDLILLNKGIFEMQGKILNQKAKKTCKCLVIANPVQNYYQANTNCKVLAENALSIPKQNFTCMTRLDLNRAKSLLAKKANVSVNDIYDLILWGNHSVTQFPDTTFTKIKNRKANEVIDQDWLKNYFVQKIKNRGSQILLKKKMSTVLACVLAIKDHVQDWKNGSKNQYLSMGVYLQKEVYGVRKGLCFSLPVICEGNYKYRINQSLELNEYQKQKLKLSEAELIYQQRMMNQQEQYFHV